VLKNGPGLILADTFWHHVQNVMHNRKPQLQVEVRFHSLLGDGFGDAFAVAAFELAGKQISEPALQQGDYTAKKKDPNPPSRRPEATTAQWKTV
jgi:hypothetical protein